MFSDDNAKTNFSNIMNESTTQTNDKFDGLMDQMLTDWDKGITLEELAQKYPFADKESEEEYNRICKILDKNHAKFIDLQKFKEQGGTTKEWSEYEITNACDKVGASDEQKEQGVNIVNESLSGQLTRTLDSAPETKKELEKISKEDL